MRYFVCISYDGTKFYGWQKQANSDNTIQYHMDHCLSTLLKSEICTVGCGRTDAGVHAKNFYLHFDHDGVINIEDTRYKANKILPSTIVVHKILAVHDEAHARFDAYERSYVYCINMQKDPFQFFSYYYSIDPSNLNLALLNELAGEIAKANDFAAFCKTNGSATTSICTIHHTEWIFRPDDAMLEFHITANRFLRGMIRLLVGAMLHVHRGKMTKAQFEAALQSQRPLPFPLSVEANGLMLYGIKYPYIEAK
jgi:tRNA pseudouridine38-40 synthase